jgi:hypothetical protein
MMYHTDKSLNIRFWASLQQTGETTMRKQIAAILAAIVLIFSSSFLPTSVPVVGSTPALAWQDPCPGSCERGLVATRIPNSLGPWGVPSGHHGNRHGGNGYRAGGAFYNSEDEQRKEFRWERSTTVQTHRRVWDAVDKVGVGRSVPPGSAGCFMLPNGNMRCANR